MTPRSRPLEQRVPRRYCNLSIEIHPSSPGGVLDLQGMEEGIDRVDEAARSADFDRHMRGRVPGRGYEVNICRDLGFAAKAL